VCEEIVIFRASSAEKDWNCGIFGLTGEAIS
jgi:hypothetical protein